MDADKPTTEIGHDFQPGTRWDQSQVAEHYDNLSGTCDWVLGYPFMIRELVRDAVPESVLDLGCGNGKIAAHLATTLGCRVVAVDPSPAMLAVGVDRHNHPLVEYSLTNGEDLTFLTDNSMDAAICCFVFVNVSHSERIQHLTREVHRVLRPGGRFIVLDVHPDSTGIQFAGHRNGLPRETYRDGQLRPAVLGPPDSAQMHLIDYH